MEVVVGLRAVLMVSFLVLSQTLGIKCCLREEGEALLDIKAYFHRHCNESLVKKAFSSWVTDELDSDCCTWNRVECHLSSDRVSKLSLQTLDLGVCTNMAIDFSLFRNFKELTILNFSLTRFYAVLSLENTAVLANLSNLEVLALKGNFLEGPLPLQELCNLKKIHVLDLSDNFFTGSLHKCLANLTFLRALDLSNNDITGEIPASAITCLTSLEYFSAMNNPFSGLFHLTSFSNNSRLKVLSLEMANSKIQVNTESEGLSYWVPSFQLQVLHLANCKLNSLSGTFPSFLLYQHDLQYLDLSNNDLVGVFPNWLLLNNTKLRTLRLHRNKFTGSLELPTYIDPHPLINLQLNDNKVEGELPTNFGLTFPNLENLYVSGNELNGRIPPSIGNMSKLIDLDLSRNKFSSQVPESLWAGCASLQYLILSQNNLRGKLFPFQMNFSSLQWLLLDNNYLGGTLDHEIRQLPHLEALDISNNNFWGIIPTFISNSSSLGAINLSRNNFTGPLPREFCKLDLSFLRLSYNKLSGSIPACYLNRHLSFLELQGNSLVGSIPTLVRSGDSLITLDLRDNKLSGVIPDWIVKEKSLFALLLGGNKLHGQLPNQLLCQLEEIRFLDLSRNNFAGNIPACLNNFSTMEGQTGLILYMTSSYHSYISYHYNSLHLLLNFEVDEEITIEWEEIDFRTKNLLLPYKGDILGFMSGIDLSSNQLTGNIPQEIGNLDDLHALNLSHNHLNGSIPKSFRYLSAIESIDLSNNNLDGEIPMELQDLNFLGVFNVSYNNLSGTVPSLLTFDDTSFMGNQYLHWNISNRGNSIHVPRPSPPLNIEAEEDESVIDFTSFIWSFAACYVAVLVIMATVLWINPYWRRLWFYYIETCLHRCFYPYLKDAFW